MIFICDECDSITIRKTQRKKYYIDFIFCSKICLNQSQKSGKIKTKKENIFQKKYGVKNPTLNKNIKDKIKQTTKKNYGVENISQSEQIKNKKREKYIKNFGVDSPLKSEQIKEKQKQTCLNKYGVSSFLKTKKCRENLKQKSLERYGVDHHMKCSNFIKNIFKKCFFEKYGVDNPNKLEAVKTKIRRTCEQKYGVDNVLKTEKSKINFKKNLEQRFNDGDFSSKPENKLYEFLKQEFGGENIQSPKKIIIGNGKVWFIDFYIKNYDVYLQFDGIFWHKGNNRSIEEILELSKTFPLFEGIYNNIQKDIQQDQWFKERNLKLIRVNEQNTYEQIACLIRGENGNI
jgi:hypothetical protein